MNRFKTNTVRLMMALSVFSGSAQAARYEKVLQCEGAHVDVNADERRELQLVVTDPGALRFLHEYRYQRPGSSPSAVASLKFGDTDYIVKGSTFSKMNFRGQYGPKLEYPAAAGVFQPADFDYFIKSELGFPSIYHYGYISEVSRVGAVTTIYRKGSDLHLQYAQIEAKGCTKAVEHRTDCGGEGGGTCSRRVCAAEEYTNFDVVLDYRFANCQ